MKCDTIQELERFLQIQVQAVGKVNPEVAITLSKLANLYAANGNYAKAELLHNRALEIRLGVAGPHQSEVEDSRRSLQRVRELREKADKSIHVSSSLGNIDSSAQASLNSRMGVDKDDKTSEVVQAKRPQITDTIKEMELEVALLKQMVGADHPACAESLTRLADLYCRAKMYQNMEPVLVEALRIRESLHGVDHPSVSSDIKNLAQLYAVQGKYSEAEALFKRAIAIRGKALGATHPKVVEMEAQYAKLLRKTRRFAQAEELERQIKEARPQKSDLRP
jgi:tetratricopeptide (TPR) repeat protein